MPSGPAASALRLAEALVTRLCHDLSGAMSTMTNALEMAAEEPAPAANEALAIAVEGGSAMSARLRLLRAAWGGGLGALPVSEVIALLDGLPGLRRLRIETELVAETEVLPPPLARVLLNVLMLAAEGLPHGGSIIISGSVRDGIMVMLAGRGAAWQPGLPRWLAEPQSAWSAFDDPRRLSGPLTAVLAAAEEVSLSLLMGGPPTDVPPLLIRSGRT